MAEYSTRQIFYDEQPELLKKITFGCNIKLDYREDPSNLHWIDNQGSYHLLQYFPDGDSLKKLEREEKRAFELIIISPDELLAININNLIYAGRLLCYPVIDFDTRYLYKASDVDEMIEIGGNFIKQFRQNDIFHNLIPACLIASLASKKKLDYALEKFYFSLRLDHLTPHSVDPFHGKIFSTDIREKRSHINSTYSFLCAYSIIEELDLDIRSSSKNHGL